MITKVTNAVLWTYVISNCNGEEIAGMFYVKELQKRNQKEFGMEKVMKRKGDKVYRNSPGFFWSLFDIFHFI